MAQYFTTGKGIDFKDYVGAGAQVCRMKIRDMLEDRELPETQTLLGYEVSWNINYTEHTKDPIV